MTNHCSLLQADEAEHDRVALCLARAQERHLVPLGIGEDGLEDEALARRNEVLAEPRCGVGRTVRVDPSSRASSSALTN
jgi:hypothetical protein